MKFLRLKTVEIQKAVSCRDEIEFISVDIKLSSDASNTFKILAELIKDYSLAFLIKENNV